MNSMIPIRPETLLPLLPDWAANDPRVLALLRERGHPGPAFGQYGVERFQAGDMALAAKAFSVAASLQPDHAIFHNNHGVALNALGDHEGAVEAFKASLALDGKQPQIWLNLAYSLNSLDRTDEAEQALITASESPATMVEAVTALGRLCLERGDYAEAADFLRHAVEGGGGNAALHATLGAALFQLGRPREAASVYALAATLDPKQAGYRDNADFLGMLDGVLQGEAESAISAYAAPLTEDAVLLSAFTRALVYLTSFDEVDAARALVTEWVQYYPDDAEALYFQQVLSGDSPSQASHAYVAAHFDQLADQMDAGFLRSLDYHVPEQMAALIARTLPKSWTGEILDAGCGNGMLARELKRNATRFAGVDLSPRMIEHAKGGGLYDELIVGDLVEWMEGHRESYDLVAAADSLIYFGSLDTVFAAAAGALRRRGWFLFSLETREGENFHLMPSGRFKHSVAYVRKAAGSDLRLVRELDVTVRKQAGHPVQGTIFLFQKVEPLTARL